MPAPHSPPPRLFGTDGIRGQAGVEPLTEASVLRIGRAIARVLARERGLAHGHVLLGHDGRRSGPWIEAALCRGMAAEALGAVSAGLITTPGLALETRAGHFDLGIMVSASHNPAADNGIKVFDRDGSKLPDELELAIEAELATGLPLAPPAAPPSLDPGVAERYLEHLLAAVPGLDLGGLSLVIDCANGGSSRIGPRLFERLGARTTALFHDPDGENINRGCGSTHPEALQAAVRSSGADLGLALDGDGDRCLLVEEHGRLVDGDALLALLARHLTARAELPGKRIVATVMSNQGLQRSLSEAGLSMETVGVGDRRVVEALRAGGLGLGGEQSGHIVFGARHHYIGDGLYTALRVLEALRASGGSLSRLAAVFEAFPQVLVNVRVRSKPELAGLPGVGQAVAELEAQLGGEGRVFLRYSGTENLARVMVEGPERGLIQAGAERIAERIRAAIGA
jgi:phosphoglucosamine mutase